LDEEDTEMKAQDKTELDQLITELVRYHLAHCEEVTLSSAEVALLLRVFEVDIDYLDVAGDRREVRLG
jgi:hypothetical protein